MAAAGLLLARFTTTPLGGATPLSVSTPVLPVPPITLVGLSVTEVRLGGFTVSVACWFTPP